VDCVCLETSVTNQRLVHVACFLSAVYIVLLSPIVSSEHSKLQAIRAAVGGVICCFVKALTGSRPDHEQQAALQYFSTTAESRMQRHVYVGKYTNAHENVGTHTHKQLMYIC